MNPIRPAPHDLPAPITRRQMLRQCSLGFGQLALAGALAADSPTAVAPGSRAMFRPRAKRVIFLFMHGGPSHVDTFDYKPALIRDSGKPLPFAKPRIQFAQTSNLRRSPWEFRPCGQSGAMVSELFPLVGACADDLCFVKSVHGTNEAHGGALLKLHTGSDTFVRPSMGSWISYGLGTENRNLPSFITINPTLGHGGVGNWSSAFLPAVHQGTPLGGGVPVEKATIHYLHDPGENVPLQRAQLDFLGCAALTECATAAEASPVTLVDATDPPFLVTHSLDEFLPVAQSDALVTALRGAGIATTYLTVEGDLHGVSILDDAMAARVVEFFRATLALVE